MQFKDITLGLGLTTTTYIRASFYYLIFYNIIQCPLTKLIYKAPRAPIPWDLWDHVLLLRYFGDGPLAARGLTENQIRIDSNVINFVVLSFAFINHCTIRIFVFLELQTVFERPFATYALSTAKDRNVF